MKRKMMEIARKRLIMRAEHRGMKEMDIILGGFVRRNIDRFDQAQIEEIEELMEIDDQWLYLMILGKERVDPRFDQLVNWIKESVQSN